MYFEKRTCYVRNVHMQRPFCGDNVLRVRLANASHTDRELVGCVSLGYPGLDPQRTCYRLGADAGSTIEYGLVFRIAQPGLAVLGFVVSDAKTGKRCASMVRSNVRIPPPIWFRMRPYFLLDEPSLAVPLAVNTSRRTREQAKLRVMLKQRGRTAPAAKVGPLGVASNHAVVRVDLTGLPPGGYQIVAELSSGPTKLARRTSHFVKCERFFP